MRRATSLVIHGLAAYREKAIPHRDTDAAAEALSVMLAPLSVTGRTVRRWEAGDPVKWRFVRALEQLYGVAFPEAHEAEAHSTPVMAIRPRVLTASTTSKDERRQLAALYNTRKAQGAPASELKAIYKSLWAAYHEIATAGAPDDADPEYIDVVTRAFVDRYANVSQQSQAESKRKRRP